MNVVKDRRLLSYAGPESWYVYALLDPRDNTARYVGSSFSPHARLNGHLNTPAVSMRGWILELRELGRQPLVEILGSFQEKSLALAHEGFLIASMKKRGVRLFNSRSAASNLRAEDSWRSGGIDTEGRRLFIAFMRSERLTQTAVADLFGVRQSSVSLWMQGRSRPEPHHRMLLEDFAGIPTSTWMTSGEISEWAAARERIRLYRQGAA